MKNKQKGFANILLIITVIVLVGIVGYITLVKKVPTTEVQTETANWKTYSNSVLNFTVQIPQNATVEVEKNDAVNKLVYIKYGNNNFFEVRLNDAKNYGKTLDNHFYLGVQNRVESTLGGRRAHLYKIAEYGEGGERFPASIALVTDYNGYFYNVTFFGVTSLSDIENKIISSFKFIN